MKLVKLIVMFPLCFFLPGYFFLRSSLFDEKGSDWLTRLLVVICFSASISSLVALFLAEIGFLKLRLLAAALAFICLIIWVAFSASGVRIFEKKPPKKELAVIIALLILGLGMFFIPSEHIIGDGDPGYYYNTGYHLAETGSLTIKDDYLKVMDEAEKKTFFDDDIAQFMPYYVRSFSDGTLYALLYHLLPVWIAIFIRVFGPFGGLYVIPFFSLLSMLVLFSLARRFSNTWAAGASTALATVFYLQVWCSKSPVSEILCQFFVLASLFFFVQYLDKGGKASAITSGLCVTVAALTRPEAALFIVFMLFVLFVWLFIPDERRGRFVFPNILLLGSFCVTIYARFPQYLYVKRNMEKFAGVFSGFFAKDILIWMLPAIFLFFLLFNLKPLRAWFAHLGESLRTKLKARSQAIYRWIKIAICISVLGLCAYLYFYSPRVASTPISPQRNFFDFSVFLGGAAIFIFLFGFIWLLYESNLSVSFLFA
ncbi:MAG: glycosyltransferase family 39 protein, partial [Actinomycetota bacterium]|nr:glycosyltransferase family 39 protein [Actinomycetota bacterium]